MNFTEALNIINHSIRLTEFEKMLISSLITTGLRISELLSINVANISPNGEVYVKSKKGSRARYIVLSNWHNVSKECKGCDYKLGDIYSRFYIYRKMKSIGLQSITTSKFNNKVTHLGRNLFVEHLRSQGIGDKEISEILGHKNYKSINYYGYKKK